MIDFRLGRYQDVLQDVECDAVICDPPYGDRTHKGHNAGVKFANNAGYYQGNDLNYASWSVIEVMDFVRFWNGRNRGWFAIMTSHDLVPVWETQLSVIGGRYVFAPIPCVIPGMTVRLAGDGPSSWCVWLVVARPRNEPFSKWGTLRGAYQATKGNEHIGGKPLELMNAIIRDYSRPGDLICDPCVGAATTLIAAASQDRRAVGSEMDPETYTKATKRIEAGFTVDMFAGSA